MPFRLESGGRILLEGGSAMLLLEGELQASTRLFTPPTVFDRPLTLEEDGLAFRLLRHFAAQARGVNVWKLLDGTYTRVQPLYDTLIDKTYLGGHIYTVTPTEAAALTAAGYGLDLLTVIQTVDGLDIVTDTGLILVTT